MPREIKNILIVTFLLFVGGSLGYYMIEDWSFLDALYMTVITLSTTGFKETYPLSNIANTFTTLSARGINPDLRIIARAEEESSKEKLLKAGADRVVLPYEIGGFRITQALLRPTVVDYMDKIVSRTEMDLEIEEVKILEDSGFINKSVSESKIRSKFNIIIVGIYREEGEMIYNPGSETKLHLNDNLIVIGEREKLKKFENLANANKK